MSDTINICEAKVVINKRHGGYGLSRKAIERLIELGCEEAKVVLEEFNDKEYLRSDPLYDIPRHHPLLIQVVEELGEEANGDSAELKVVNIKLGYDIIDYDGLESIGINGYADDY